MATWMDHVGCNEEIFAAVRVFLKKEASVEGGVQKKSNLYMEHFKKVQSSAKAVMASDSQGERSLTDSSNHWSRIRKACHGLGCYDTGKIYI